ncbi:MAG: PHP domain-containing protein [Negativicutes bacterium]|nr:PHP domain-containing protein [Negativicutes bacterium]
MSLRAYVADLHVHTLLSPCGDLLMSPRNVVATAAEAGVDILAITDHNAGDNVAAAISAAVGYPLTVLPGMEVETREEVHILALFGKMRQFRQWEEVVRQHLSPLANDDDRFGIQAIVDADDNLVGVRRERLIAPLTASIEQVVVTVNRLGGMCVAAHVDKAQHSIIGQLGFVPPGLALAAVEVSRLNNPQTVKLPGTGGLPRITSSDAHYTDDLRWGSKTEFLLAGPTLAEIRQALAGENGRKILGYRLDHRVRGPAVSGGLLGGCLDGAG